MYSIQLKMSTIFHIIIVFDGNIYVSEGEIPKTNPLEYYEFRASPFGVDTRQSFGLTPFVYVMTGLVSSGAISPIPSPCAGPP